MQMRRRGSAFATLMALVALISTAHAAQISAPGLHAIAVKENDKISTYWPTDPVKCDLILDGDIVEGDAVTLKQKFETIVGSWNAFSFFLCLRSLGGSVPEALKIAKFILDTQRPSIAAVVEDGQICASACAFIFLAGNAPAARSAWPQRFLHLAGNCAFIPHFSI
jgi:membrane-bound ClpP family serine protease